MGCKEVSGYGMEGAKPSLALCEKKVCCVGGTPGVPTIRVEPVAIAGCVARATMGLRGSTCAITCTRGAFDFTPGVRVPE